MSLRDFVISTRTIAIGGDQKFSVRALGFDDIQHFLVARGSLVEQALDLLGGIKDDADSADPEQMRAVGAKLLAALPDLAAEVIAVAADEPDTAPQARRLPAPVQLEALMAVYELTFSEPDSVKKFFDRLADLMKSIPRPKAVLQKTSIGSASSGAMSGS